jgi:hypothetical protein
MNAYINGEYRCYSTANGISRHYLGCRHMKPRDAIRHVANTDPYVSPRRSGEASTPTPSAPLPGSGQLDASPEPRGSGLLGQAR